MWTPSPRSSRSSSRVWSPWSSLPWWKRSGGTGRLSRRTGILISSAALVLASTSGCVGKVVWVDETVPVRLGEDVVGHVYYPEGQDEQGKVVWRRSPNVVHLPMGAYVVGPSFVQDGTKLPALGSKDP